MYPTEEAAEASAVQHDKPMGSTTSRLVEHGTSQARTINEQQGTGAYTVA